MKIFSSIFIMTVLFGCSHSDEQLTESNHSPSTRHIETQFNNVSMQSELVFENIKLLDQDGSVISEENNGKFTGEILQKSARPYTQYGLNNEFIYNSHTSVETSSSGNRIVTYRITRTKNNNPSMPPNLENEELSIDPLINDLLNEQSTTSEDSQPVYPVNIKLKNIPYRNIPIRLNSEFLSEEENIELNYSAASNEDEYISKMISISNDVEEYILSNGGQNLEGPNISGWISVEVPINVMEGLVQRDDIVTIRYDLESHDNSCVSTCHENEYDATDPAYSDRWILGNGMKSEFIDAEQFLNSWRDGQRTNSARHSHPRLMTAAIERNDLWDEACYLMSSSNCSITRVTDKFIDCSSYGTCTPVVDFDQSGETSDSHATLVTSIMMGDMIDYQGNNRQLNDLCWLSGSTGYHCDDFRYAASGVAREAAMAFFGRNPTQQTLAGSYISASNNNYGVLADVINATNTTVDNQCDPFSSEIDSDAIETAYDNGAFFVIASGNNGTNANDSCDLDHPADTPKAFTVASIDTTTTDCKNGDYSQCMQSYRDSLRGGADFVSLSGTTTGSLTMVDLIAPGCISKLFDVGGVNGEGVLVNNSYCGSSLAAPHVSGAAILVKHWMLDLAVSVINNPGVLFAVMLGMGDRYSENTGGQAEVGGDPRSGFGRLKLRLLDGEQFSIDSYTFNTAQYTTHSYIPFSSPIGSTAKIVKCVSHNSEDVSSWNSFGEVNLSIRAMEPHIQYLPPPYSPIKYCALPSTMVSNSLIVDNMKDNKHMVAANQYTSVDISKYLGKCLLVDVQGRTPWKTFYYYGIPYISNKLVTSHVFCYVADKSDEE